MDEVRCNTCDDSGRWLSTTEDSPTDLVYLGTCPDCGSRMEGFPREVVISPEYGAGMASWWMDECPPEVVDKVYEIVEHPVFIECVRNKFSWKDTCVQMYKLGYEMITDFYPGGWEHATVVEVSGPYAIVEYDGFESILYKRDRHWRK